LQAAERTLQEILYSPAQYVIPVFQRYYVWGPANWEQLWGDLRALLEYPEEKRRHFLGSIVCVPEQHQPGVVPAYQVIDGQQLLTTLSILLSAIRDTAAHQGWEEMAAEGRRITWSTASRRAGNATRYTPDCGIATPSWL
jgi:hypothetical protein